VIFVGLARFGKNVDTDLERSVTMDWHDKLEGLALEIAASDKSPLRVLAGPGTGKTFALMRRILRLLQNGVPPQRILVCTFTKTAASDLRKALVGLDVEDAQRVDATTLHSLSFKVLSFGGVWKVMGRNPRPLLTFEERFLLEDIKTASASKFGIRECRERLRALSAAWARLQTDEPGHKQDADDVWFAREVLEWLKLHRAMLLDELVPEAYRFLRANPASPVRLAYDYVLVDEYQDLNRAEQALVDVIAAQGKTTVVGDEDQSIYSFRYANPEGIATYHTTHAGTHDLQLEVCRRCPAVVVETANSLISNNLGRTPRALKTHADKPRGDLSVVQWRTREHEAEGIAAFVRDRISSGRYAPGDVLILAPQWNCAQELFEAIGRIKIPVHSAFGNEMFAGQPSDREGCTAQEAITLLTLLADKEDLVALRCWCGFGSATLASAGWREVMQYSMTNGVTPFEALDRAASGGWRLKRDKKFLLSRFADLKARLAAMAGMTGAMLADTIFPMDTDWARPVRELLDVQASSGWTPESLRDALRTSMRENDIPSDVDFVRVMSLYKSKGLTAKLVVVVGCVDGTMPRLDEKHTADEERRAIEEQRRLFYVAMTRASEELVLSSAALVPTKDAHRMGVKIFGKSSAMQITHASRYLSELGPSAPASVSGVEFLRAAAMSST
jgi:DNA helicase II / ATP-dependent DNA helicase PcrA